MFKSKIFASELEMEEAIGDVDDMGTIINSGETVVDNYNNGDKSVKARLGGMMSSDVTVCLLYTSPSPRDRQKSRMPSSA